MTAIQSQITSCSSFLSQKCGIDALNNYTYYQGTIDQLKIIGEYL